MVRLLLCSLLLAGCALPTLPRYHPEPPSPAPSPPSQLDELNQALQLEDAASTRARLDSFIAAHPDDAWGELARSCRTFSDRLTALEAGRRDDDASLAALKQENSELRRKLKSLQQQLDELTQTLIDQATRQP